MARVESVRKVEIEGDTSGIGSGTGVLLGGAAGYNTIGKGSGRTYGALLGAMLGWAASSAIEKNMNSRAGVELTVLTENRSRYVLVQDDDGTVFNVGDVVKLVDNNGKTRVIK
jgi:outer membrane lipoprotein SlyB